MRYLLQILSLFLAFNLWGCASVYVESPLGGEPLVLEASDWEGQWVGGGDAVAAVRVVDRDRGVLQVSEINYEPGDRAHLDSETVYLRQWNDFLFAGVPTQGEDDRPLFFWARLERVGNRVVFWLPDHHKIKALVEAGKLPGTIEKDGDVVLGQLEEAHYRILTSEEEGILYQWENPGVLMRILPGGVKLRN